MPTITFNQIGNPSNNNDGSLFSSNAVWATTLAGSALVVASGGSADCGTLGADKQPSVYRLYRVFGSFDTTSLGGVTISSAALILRSPNVPGPAHSLKAVQWTASGVPAVLATSAWSQIGSDCTATVTMAAIMAAGPSGLSVPLNATGISQIHTTGTAPTRFAFRSQDDYSNTAPVSPSEADLTTLSMNSINPNFNMQLVVTYSTGVSPTFTSIAPPSGTTAGGTAVAIVGGGFQVGATVTIGGVACSAVIVNSATSISCITGPHTAVGLVAVKITNPDAGTVSSNAFTYTAVAPHAGGISPISGSLSGGTPCSITGSGFSSGGSPINSVTFGGSPATSVVVQSDTLITCLSPPGFAGPVNVTVTNPNGAGSSTLVNAFTYFSGPPAPAGPGSQLIYDFTRQIWYSASYGSLQSMISIPIQGNPYILGLDTSGSVNIYFSDDSPGVNNALLPMGRGFLQTEPVSFGSSNTIKQFPFVRLVVNDVTAINPATPGLFQTWLVFAYVDNQTVPYFVPMIVNPQPYNRFPFGMMEGTNCGELIGYLHNQQGGPVMGHNIRVEVYYPTGIPKNTPISGESATPSLKPLNLPWTVYQIDVSAQRIDESLVEP